jgi:biopolymer transport protein ExbB
MKHLLLILAVLLFSTRAHAWWNEDWPSRLPISVEAVKGTNPAAANLTQVPVLIRLHAGNFEDFFSIKEDLSDLRLVGPDDKTEIPFQVDHFDLMSQVLLIWVVLPEFSVDKPNKLFLYYGNQNAAQLDNARINFGNAAAVLHFNDMSGVAADASLSGSVVALTEATVSQNGMVGRATAFSKESQLSVQLNKPWKQSDGGAVSFWLKGADSSDGNVLSLSNTANINLQFMANELQLSVGAEKFSVPGTAEKGRWHHVGLRVDSGNLEVLINGELKATASLSSVASAEFTNIIFGKTAAGNGFQGELDEVAVIASATTKEQLSWAYKNQGMGDASVTVSGAEQLGTGGHAAVYGVIINSMDHISWVVVAIMAVMMVIGWIIMVAKWLYLRAVNADNRAFLKEYAKLGNRDPAMLDYDPKDNEDEYSDMHPITQAIFGPHDRYQSSPIFHLFHRGMKEVKTRLGTSLSAQGSGHLTPQAVSTIRAALDAQMTREIQKMQSKMTFLTMSVSGGPFIGLFGTVAGVMITFGAIAAAGDVNINAIAPGVAAALVATVGGLLVAIPAMFGYNWLSGLIKDAIADMRVFADEYVAKLAEYYQEQDSV